MKLKMKYSSLVVTALLIGGLCLCSRYFWRSDRAIGDMYSFKLLLQYYALEHEGDMPNSMEELRDGYCRVRDNGWWEVLPRPDLVDASGANIAHPEWFDVAWGAKAHEIDEKGMVTTRDRLVVRASEKAPEWFASMAERISPWLAAVVIDVQAQATTTAPSPNETGNDID